MQLATYHQEVKSLITERMGQIFSDVRGMSFGGKHLRGLLCVLTSDALGGDRDRALTSAAVVDAVHEASLIHDDIVDQDMERRGHPSLWVTDGIKKAVLTGDRVLAIAQKRVAMLGNQESREVAEALDITVGSWITEGTSKPAELLMDLFIGQVPEVGYQKLCLAKTAPFFKAAARLGGMAADSDDRALNALGSYAERIGLAFQYSDDLVDIIKLQKEGRIPDWRKLVPIIPAIIHYNGSNLRQALFEVPWGIFKDSLVGKGPGEKLLGLLSQLDIDQRLTADIQKECENAIRAIESIEAGEDYQEMMKDYPYYAVNLMLAEVDKELEPK
jgi:geranylgeranyl pyrophosphate synthase